MKNRSLKSRIVIMMATIMPFTIILVGTIRINDTQSQSIAATAERLESNVVMTDLVFTKMMNNAWSTLDVMYAFPALQTAMRGGPIEPLHYVLWPLFEINTMLGEITLGGNVFE
ncbi:MAG: hypothetical protein FWB78_02820, partial [Treponema sp.]|nr:hypothetical protein [Treponema sp.]